MVLTTTHLIVGIYSLVGLLLVAILYNFLFIVVDLRKVMRKVTEASERVEAMVDVPLTMAEEGMTWLFDYLQHFKKPKRTHVHTQEHKRAD